MRHFSDITENRIKAGTRQLIKSAGGTEMAAEDCRVGRSQLSNCENINSEQFIPIDALVDLTAATGDTRLIDDLVRIIKPVTCQPLEITQSMTVAHKEGAEAITAALESQSDGVLTYTELHKMGVETRQAIAAFEKLLKTIENEQAKIGE